MVGVSLRALRTSCMMDVLLRASAKGSKDFVCDGCLARG